ncbi:MAG: septal ring lytic transglycosylase RlpA family protein [Campylobacterota bacterium]|nr:septal ring lytic transglycosylase RlpA family protein [Campylobacterota bacterium]
MRLIALYILAFILTIIAITYDTGDNNENNQTQTTPPKTVQKTPIFLQEGVASYYADKFQGKPTASGELYDREVLSGAHKTLPFGTMVKVTRASNDKSVIVRINDRGPYSKKRVIDLSYRAAQEIDLILAGVATVKVEVLPK